MPSQTVFRDSLAGTVRAELARRQMSIAAAAAAAGLSKATMARRLQDGDFKIDELAGIADHLGMLVSDLLPADVEAAS